MSSLQRFTANYLNFTNKEKAGILGLLLCIGIFQFLPDFLLTQKDYSKEILQFHNEIAALQSIDTIEYSYSSKEFEQSAKVKLKPFYFDPNTVDPKLLSGFGLYPKLIERFAKFRDAGAKFYKKEDMKRIFGMKPEYYERMEPYIRFEEKGNKEYHERKETIVKEQPSKSNKIVDLNTADSNDLISVKGIGPFLSSKIIKYRKALGGYVNFDQLFEIYGLKPEQIEPLRSFVIVTSKNIRGISVNDADYETLNAHPYLSGKEAMAIIKYRKQHGKFQNRSDLEKIILIPKVTIDKLEPYLVF